MTAHAPMTSANEAVATATRGRSEPRPTVAAVPKMPYLAGLDGIRAIAVVAVLLYHNLDAQGLPSVLRPSGGFLGVEVFFVISGYLITALLLGEHERSGTIGLKGFWGRRARRLLPALYVFLAGATLMAVLFATDALDKIRAEILGAIFYVTNWLLILQDESYFEAAGRPSLLRHLWSLAIEEQFYLLWPLLVLGGLKFFGRRPMARLTLAGAALSTALMWVLFNGIEQYGDVTSIYYRTDTRAAALLIGGAAGLVWRPWARSAEADQGEQTRPRFRAELLAVAALVAVVWVQYWFTDNLVEWDKYEVLFRGGFLLTSVPTIILICAIAVPGSRVGALLGLPILRWIGTRSYGLYLWHWPVFQLTRPRVDVQFDGWTLLAVRLVITCVLVETSYQLVERPIRERRFRSGAVAINDKPLVVLRWAGGAVAFALALAVTLPWLNDRATADQTQEASELAAVDEDLVDAVDEDTVDEDASEAESAGAEEASNSGAADSVGDETQAASPPASPAPASSPVSGGDQLAHGVPWPVGLVATDLEVDPALLDPAAAARARRITIFGDSVVLGSEKQLLKLSDDVVLDGRVGRQWWDASDELTELVEEEPLGEIVVVHLGNNGALDDDMFDDLMHAIGEGPDVVFVTVRVPRNWEGSVNKAIAEGVERWSDQAVLADWYAAANDNPEYFTADGHHLERDGQRALRKLIRKAINNT